MCNFDIFFEMVGDYLLWGNIDANLALFWKGFGSMVLETGVISDSLAKLLDVQMPHPPPGQAPPLPPSPEPPKPLAVTPPPVKATAAKQTARPKVSDSRLNAPGCADEPQPKRFKAESNAT